MKSFWVLRGKEARKEGKKEGKKSCNAVFSLCLDLEGDLETCISEATCLA